MVDSTKNNQHPTRNPSKNGVYAEEYTRIKLKTYSVGEQIYRINYGMVDGKKILLTATAKVIYTFLTAVSWSMDDTYPNNTDIMECCALAKQTVTDGIERLEQLGLVKVYKRYLGDGRESSSYKVVLPKYVEKSIKFYNHGGLILNGEKFNAKKPVQVGFEIIDGGEE